MNIDLKSLHRLEVKLLRSLNTDEQVTPEGLVSALSLNIGQINQAISWLFAKELLAELSRESRVSFELTDLGNEYRQHGTPGERILDLLRERGSLTLPEIAGVLGLEKRDVGSAYGALAKEGVLSMDAAKSVSLQGDGTSARLALIHGLLDRAVATGWIEENELSDKERIAIEGISRRRGAGSEPFRVIEREAVAYGLTELGLQVKQALVDHGLTGEEIGAITPDLLESGDWRSKGFRAYNINTPPRRVLVGRRNPYSEYLEQVKDQLVSLGFEEFDGPLVETEFWNADALYMPQFHSAREIHDVYNLKDPSHAREIDQPWLDQVASAHEDGWTTGSRGWGYTFDREFTRRLILRSQGTVLSAKQLPKAKVPGKYFGIARCFRYDQVDATHGAEFYQTEGIVLGEEVNLKTLLGLLKMFAIEVAGATDYRFAPGYFPFTEPSIEVFIKHPVLGWFELGGSGIFRPEVTKPLGIEVPVLAWGLGIDRMALMQLGLDDMRELFSADIEKARLRRRE